MKKFLSVVVFIADVLFFVLYYRLITNSVNFALNAFLIIVSLVAVTFLKSLTINENVNTIIFRKKEFLKIFFTEDLFKFFMIMAFMFCINKLLSAIECFLIILGAFVVYVLGVIVYYLLVKKYRAKQQAK